jgi:O-Antigen ligase
MTYRRGRETGAGATAGEVRDRMVDGGRPDSARSAVAVGAGGPSSLPPGPGVINVSAVQLALLLTLILGIGWQGAYYRGGQLALGLGLTLAVGASLAARGPHLNKLAWPPVLAVLLVGAWTLLDATLHGATGRGSGGAALAVAVAAALAVVWRSEYADRLLLVMALPVVGGLAATSAWLGLVMRIPGWSLAAQGLWRAAGTLTYPNATAGVLVPLALLAIAVTAGSAGTATGAGLPLVPTWAMRLLATLMVTGVLATLSRGGYLALTVGLVLLTALGGRPMLRAAAGPLSGAVVAFIGLVPSLPTGAGRHPLPAAGAMVAGLAVAHLVGRFVADGAPSRRPQRPTILLAVAAAGCLIVAATIAVGPQLRTVADVRLGSGSANRAGAARAALSLLRENPVVGTGPGGAVTTWHDSSGASRTLRYLHDEYLQVLVEDGVVGGFLLLVLLIAGVMAARQGLRAPPHTAATGAVWAGGVAAMGAFAVGSAVDFLWHIPVLPILAATVFAATLAAPSTPVRAARAVRTSVPGSA